MVLFQLGSQTSKRPLGIDASSDDIGQGGEPALIIGSAPLDWRCSSWAPGPWNNTDARSADVGPERAPTLIAGCVSTRVQCSGLVHDIEKNPDITATDKKRML